MATRNFVDFIEDLYRTMLKQKSSEMINKIVFQQSRYTASSLVSISSSVLYMLFPSMKNTFEFKGHFICFLHAMVDYTSFLEM